MEYITKRQEAVLKAIKKHKLEKDEYPTFVELAFSLKMQPNGAAEHCKALIKKGYLINSGAHKARSLRLTDKAESL